MKSPFVKLALEFNDREMGHGDYNLVENSSGVPLLNQAIVTPEVLVYTLIAFRYFETLRNGFEEMVCPGCNNRVGYTGEIAEENRRHYNDYTTCTYCGPTRSALAEIQKLENTSGPRELTEILSTIDAVASTPAQPD